MSDKPPQDRLAIERTRLANERTLLAYVRTALALAGSGAVLYQFFPAHDSLWVLAWLLVFAGVATVGFGAWRFAVVNRQLRE